MTINTALYGLLSNKIIAFLTASPAVVVTGCRHKKRPGSAAIDSRNSILAALKFFSYVLLKNKILLNFYIQYSKYSSKYTFEPIIRYFM